MTGFSQAAEAAKLKVCVGLRALEKKHRKLAGGTDRVKPVGSVNLDEHFENEEPNESRWDYGVGFDDGKEFVVWIEVHPAEDGELDAMEKKLKWLKSKLKRRDYEKFNALMDAARERGVNPFQWVFVGKNKISQRGKYGKKLARMGFDFPIPHLSHAFKKTR